MSGPIAPARPQGADSEGQHLDVIFAREDMVVFEHRVPVRLVQATACPTVPGAEPAVLASGGGELLPIAVQAGEDALWVQWRAPEAVGEAEPIARDAYRTMQAMPHIEVLLDPDGAEQVFLQFMANAAGDQCDARWPFSEFHGKHLRKIDWDGDWQVKKASGDGSQLTMVIPFEALGSSATRGTHWRLAVTVRDGDGGVTQWPDNHDRDPARFGLLAFE